MENDQWQLVTEEDSWEVLMMWAEARKHEKKLKGLMIDYRRRAERRRDFYDRIRSDPSAFLQVHGMQLKIHIDPNLCSLAESSLMPWMGDNNNLIDRFDVRAHLNQLDLEAHTSQTTANTSDANNSADEAIDRQMNYERYRNLVQNEFLGVNESKFLQQIYLEERFGVNNQSQKDIQNKSLETKKKLSQKRAAISYNYDNEDPTATVHKNSDSDEESDEESSEEDYDFDTTVNIDQLDNESGHRINTIALKYGMKCDDFVKYLDDDRVEAEKIRVQKEVENEKSMFTGRKSRRERRALKEQRLMILRSSQIDMSDRSMTIERHKSDDKDVQSSSDSEVSVDENKIEFITEFSFGAESSEEETHKEVVEKKTKQVMARGKQRLKSKANERAETIPTLPVYGPTLPGEDSVSSLNTTSFNKTIHSKQRTYRVITDAIEAQDVAPNPVKDNDRDLEIDGGIKGEVRVETPEEIEIILRKQKNESNIASESIKEEEKDIQTKAPSPPLKSYYRHDLLSDESGEEIDHKEDSKESPKESLETRVEGSKQSPSNRFSHSGHKSSSTVTPQERLKRKMQALLDKQCIDKSDKKAELEKSRIKMQERVDRDDKLKQIRYRRHRNRDHRDSRSNSRSKSRTSSSSSY
ncbi:unnamed protein product [Oppiella nova]|uniref:Suppressor of white apricot N-terminal domain-containing protein n=1 Tax=Oppiella nova TaxID=334625 RepID=A0A7R9LGH8_9ACAR|nr:unnamed protein product [Oppiella nova]CAG2163447.1 unnamed protein product [Oppiella nova]